jgi:hypothetical protein
MRTQLQKKGMKIACVAFGIFSATTVANAQRLVIDGTPGKDNFAKTANVPGIAGGAIRVVDNKGTIKYLQTANGLTTITNKTADVTTTTWQLGGTLTDDTYIDATGKVFAIDGIKVTTAVASKSGDVALIHGGVSTNGTATGYTFLVRNEATGATEKLLAADMVVGGNQITSVGAPEIATPKFTVAGVTAGTFPATSYYKLSVHRNGVKLLGGTDFTADADGNVTLTPDADWALNIGDKIEINWIK